MHMRARYPRQRNLVDPLAGGAMRCQEVAAVETAAEASVETCSNRGCEGELVKAVSRGHRITVCPKCLTILPEVD